jgi:hypothetical protein
MIPTARQLFLEANPRLGRKTDASRDLLEKKFFCSLRLSNGVYKKTWAGRFEDVHQILTAEFQRLGVAPKSFLDVAVSSGASTIEWLESLQEAGLRPSMTATDLTMNVYLLRLHRWLHVLVDKEGFPLQYDVCGLAWRPRCRIRFYLLGNGLLTILWRMLYWAAARRCDLTRRLKSLHGNPPSIDDSVIKAQIKLVTYRVRDNKDIELLDDDITAPTPPSLRSRFEVIRAANILNRSYFSDQQLREAIIHLRDRLVGPGAFLLIVRTEHGSDSNNGSLFCLRDNGSFEVRARVGRGSELEDLVLSI